MQTEEIKATDNLGVIHNYLARSSTKLEENLLDACRRIDEPAALRILSELLDVSHARQAAVRALSAPPKEPAVPIYMLSSLFIRDAAQLLTKSPEEDLRFATGLMVAAKTYAITRLLEFELRLRSVVAAEGDQESVNRLMIYLHHHDHKLYMTWHSHPGGGPNATMPSSTDMDFHRRLELGNYPVIGAIVSRQGYVRFFSYQRPFRITIYGKGLEVVNEQQCIYRITTVGSI